MRRPRHTGAEEPVRNRRRGCAMHYRRAMPIIEVARARKGRRGGESLRASGDPSGQEFAISWRGERMAPVFGGRKLRSSSAGISTSKKSHFLRFGASEGRAHSRCAIARLTPRAVAWENVWSRTDRPALRRRARLRILISAKAFADAAMSSPRSMCKAS